MVARIKTFFAFVTALAFLTSGSRGQEPLFQPWQFARLIKSEPFGPWWWVFWQRAYPLGFIPEGAELRALRQIERWRAAHRADVSFALAQEQQRWISIGPAPILGGQVGARGNTRPMSGRVTAVAVDPRTQTRWLIGGAQGGVWETRDAGTSWEPLTDDQPALAIGAIAFAPSDPNIIYVGTGTAVFAQSSFAGAGLIRSTDGGRTWQLVASSALARVSFSDIKVDPLDALHLVIATAIGIAGRGRERPPQIPPTGIVTTTDGGLTWAVRLSGWATDLEVDPRTFQRQFAALGNPFGSAANGLYRSTDAGQTWTRMNGPWEGVRGGVGRIELALAPSDPNTLYISVQDAFDGVRADGGLLGLWRTSNAWDEKPTWTAISVAATDDGSGLHGYCGWDPAFRTASDQCWFDHELSVDPTNPDTLYAGGIPLWKYDGVRWTEVSKTVGDPLSGIHVDQHAMAWAGRRLIVGNDGGVWSTEDGGETWEHHNTTLAITQFYEGSIHPDAVLALAGSQDNGTEVWQGERAWRWIRGGDGADTAISSTRPDTDWALSGQNLALRRTRDAARTITIADSGIDKTGVPFIARFEKCPTNDDVFIAGTDNLWKSTNFFSAVRPTWEANSPEMRSSITALAFAPSDDSCNTYAFGTANGQLRVTRDGGMTWTDLDMGNQVPNRYVTDLAFDPNDANILYVTLSGFDEGTPGQPGHVFRTRTALSSAPTWTDVSPPVNLPHNTIVIDPRQPEVIYVGTDLGVWKSTDGAQSWIHLGPETGMPNVAVFELQIAERTGQIVAFTFGRGAFLLGGAEKPPPR